MKYYIVQNNLIVNVHLKEMFYYVEITFWKSKEKMSVILTNKQYNYCGLTIDPDPQYGYMRIKLIRKLDATDELVTQMDKINESHKEFLNKMNEQIDKILLNHVFITEDNNCYERIVMKDELLNKNAVLFHLDNIILPDKIQFESNAPIWLQCWYAHDHTGVPNHKENFGVIEYCENEKDDSVFAESILKVPYIQQRNKKASEYKAINKSSDREHSNIKESNRRKSNEEESDDDESDEDYFPVSKEKYMREIDMWDTFIMGYAKLSEKEFKFIVGKKLNQQNKSTK